MNRTFILSIAFLLLPFGGRAAATADSLWAQANTFYANGQYRDAIRVYTEIEAADNVSPALYFNMGNAFFKHNELASAILYYERALRLSPGDAAIAYNLEMAQLRTLDRVDAVPEFFLFTWIRNLRQWASADAWAILSLFLVAATLLCLSGFFFIRSVRLRKLSFFTAAACLLLAAGNILFANAQHAGITDRSEAIIFPAVVTVKSAPDNTGKDLFLLHEGAKVIIIDELSNWQNIRLPDGKEGWIEAGHAVRMENGDWKMENVF
ncbi:MAG: tetratricopeptide repeat protein [Prevotellaceae bacterium]|jgi:tetratricopeptide (TPR) repeat protein|nr:tetratricopeptide repeat protein [Prevotellaceae bacterium]